MEERKEMDWRSENKKGNKMGRGDKKKKKEELMVGWEWSEGNKWKNRKWWWRWINYDEDWKKGKGFNVIYEFWNISRMEKINSIWEEWRIFWKKNWRWKWFR